MIGSGTRRPGLARPSISSSIVPKEPTGMRSAAKPGRLPAPLALSDSWVVFPFTMKTQHSSPSRSYLAGEYGHKRSGKRRAARADRRAGKAEIRHEISTQNAAHVPQT